MAAACVLFRSTDGASLGGRHTSRSTSGQPDLNMSPEDSNMILIFHSHIQSILELLFDMCRSAAKVHNPISHSALAAHSHREHLCRQLN